jgi:hypothetical protein
MSGALPVLARTPLLVSDHNPTALLDMLRDRGFSLIDTPDCNVHALSPDGRLYIGWLPEDEAAWKRGIHLTVQATPIGATPWTQEFGDHTPMTAVTAFVTALLG